MNYLQRRKTKYFGLILIASLTIISGALMSLRMLESAQSEFDARLSKLNKIEVMVIQAQYHFKTQVQEWKNILLRGNEKESFKKHFEAFSEQFLITQDITATIINELPETHQARLVGDTFLKQHQIILSDYLSAIDTFNNNNSNARLADERVKGIDREPDKLLKDMANLLNQETARSKQQLLKELEATKRDLAAIFILLQAVLVLMLVRLTSNLLILSVKHKPTELGNRTYFVETINDCLRVNQAMFVAIVDIDEFKILNETCGNVGGDTYLRNVGQIMQNLVGKKGSVFSIGGDLLGLTLHREEVKGQQFLKEINERVANYIFHWEDISVNLSCSSASFYIDGKEKLNSEAVLNALYVGLQLAKSSGKKHMIHYSKDDQNIVWLQKQLRMVHKVSGILKDNRAVLFKQAITPIHASSAETYFEVLLRIKQGQDYQAPGLFLQAAERFHLIDEVDRYVLRAICEYLINTPHDKYNYSINLSGRTLSDKNFVGFVVDLFEKSKVDTSRLSIEITETEVIKNIENALSIIACLNRYGCKIVLDDFGTGMSSYAYIAKLKLHTIKIDGVFIKGVESNPQNQSIIRSIVRLAKELEVKTVAEFVETQEEYDTLTSLDIDFVQGYLLHKPELLYARQN